jgi:hypothetical protein
MVSSVQSKQSYTAYKVQSNQYSSTGERIISCGQHEEQPTERPGSRLKQNIDELDTLLYDLNNANNNARKMSDAGADYTASSITPGNVSSDDYSFSEGHQGHVKKTAHSYSERSYQQQIGDYGDSTRKPPSPSPRKRPQPLTSPSSVGRASPGPSRKAEHVSSSSYNYESSYSRDQQRQQGYPGEGSGNSSYKVSTAPAFPIVPSADGTPTGVSYYTKYHSTHSHQSQQQNASPATFPSSSIPRNPPLKTQTPPKRVDELLSELSEFDSSIQNTGFVEPVASKPSAYREPSPDMLDYRPAYRDPSPAHKQASGQPVYYPAPEAKTKPAEVTHTTSLGRGGKGKDKGKDKGKHSESEGKQGAAVVPICLPLCCAAPCVIM